jgi:hypothetical protein
LIFATFRSLKNRRGIQLTAGVTWAACTSNDYDSASGAVEFGVLCAEIIGEQSINTLDAIPFQRIEIIDDRIEFDS